MKSILLFWASRRDTIAARIRLGNSLPVLFTGFPFRRRKKKDGTRFRIPSPPSLGRSGPCSPRAGQASPYYCSSFSGDCQQLFSPPRSCAFQGTLSRLAGALPRQPVGLGLDNVPYNERTQAACWQFVRTAPVPAAANRRSRWRSWWKRSAASDRYHVKCPWLRSALLDTRTICRHVVP